MPVYDSHPHVTPRVFRPLKDGMIGIDKAGQTVIRYDQDRNLSGDNDSGKLCSFAGEFRPARQQWLNEGSWRVSCERELLQLILTVLFGAGLALTAGACSSSRNGDRPCLPPAYSISPTSAKPGEVVTVSASAANCDPRYGADARIQVIVTDESGAETINTTAPMTDAGEFTYTFTVPAGMALGTAEVTAMPHNIDWCDDAGKNNRAGGTLKLELASCAQPVETLTITR